MNSFSLINNSGVYRLTCVKTSFFYVGSSKNIALRWGTHIDDLRKGSHCNYKLQRDYDLYGEESFRFEMIYEADRHIRRGDLIMIEQGYIDTLKPYYNICKNLGLNPIRPKYEKEPKVQKKKKRKSGSRKTRHPNSTFGI